MKLYNVIILFDVYAVAESGEAARDAVMQFISNGDLPPSESKAIESREERNIRQSWRDQKPIVGADVTDDDFEKKIKGHTTIEIYQSLYTKQK